MEMRGVTLSTLSDTDIYAFISSRHNIQSDRFSSLRRFLSYLFTAGKTNRDLSELLFGMVRQKEQNFLLITRKKKCWLLKMRFAEVAVKEKEIMP